MNSVETREWCAKILTTTTSVEHQAFEQRSWRRSLESSEIKSLTKMRSYVLN